MLGNGGMLNALFVGQTCSLRVSRVIALEIHRLARCIGEKHVDLGGFVAASLQNCCRASSSLRSQPPASILLIKSATDLRPNNVRHQNMLVCYFALGRNTVASHL